MRYLLYDPNSGGHHESYALRFAALLRSVGAEVSLAMPGSAIERLREASPSGVELLALPTNATRPMTPLGLTVRSSVSDAVELRQYISLTESDHAVHLFGDKALVSLAFAPPYPASLTLCLFRLRAHYQRQYASRLTTSEQAKSLLTTLALRVWSRRKDAHAVLAADEDIATRRPFSLGTPIYWLPEPIPTFDTRAREGLEPVDLLLYGSLAARKGLHLLADAIRFTGAREPIRIRIAGRPVENEDEYVLAAVAAMRRAGAKVEYRDSRYTEPELGALLRAARYVCVPYPRHFGPSGVLLEAAVMRRAVIAHDFGLVGYQVRRYGLGIATDCTNPRAFGAALTQALRADPRDLVSETRLESFVRRYREGVFVSNARPALDLAPED